VAVSLRFVLTRLPVAHHIVVWLLAWAILGLGTSSTALVVSVIAALIAGVLADEQVRAAAGSWAAALVTFGRSLLSGAADGPPHPPPTSSPNTNSYSVIRMMCVSEPRAPVVAAMAA
jgi:hypothetical protein